MKAYAEPTVILISSRLDESVDQYLNPETRRGDGDDSDSTHFLSFLGTVADDPGHLHQPYILDVRPSNEFGYEAGNLLQLSSVIDVESRLSVSCAGAVLSYIQCRRAVLCLPGDPDAINSFKISSIEMFSLEGVMLVALLYYTLIAN